MSGSPRNVPPTVVALPQSEPNAKFYIANYFTSTGYNVMVKFKFTLSETGELQVCTVATKYSQGEEAVNLEQVFFYSFIACFVFILPDLTQNICDVTFIFQIEDNEDV